MHRTASVGTMKDHIPGELLRERKARAPDDIHVEIHAHAPVQEPIVVPAVPEPMLAWIVSGEAVARSAHWVGTGSRCPCDMGTSISPRRRRRSRCAGAARAPIHSA